MMRWLALAVVVAGCGRFGFDRSVGSDGGGNGDRIDAHDAAMVDVVPDAPLTPPFALTGMRYMIPCTTHLGGNGCACVNTPVVQTVQLSGSGSDQYNVTIRIRGATEVTVYTGGVAGPGYWYVGGARTSVVANLYSISVSSPAQLFWINNLMVEPTSYAVDYMASFVVAGDAMVTFTGNPQDGQEDDNTDASDVPITFAGITTTPDPYDGQFAQIDVLSAPLM